MLKMLLASLALVATAGYSTTDDKKADDRVKVEVLLATEHIPKDLKAGTRVDLKMVSGKTVAPNGLIAYNTSMVAADVEVASITNVDKPATPEAAIRVHLLVAKDKSAKVEKTRDQTVTVNEKQSDGSVTSKKKPITLRIELPKK